MLVLAQAISVWAHVVTYDWEVTWVNVAPDGFERPVIGINGAWPCPPIHAHVGDTVVINMKNGLGNQTTGLHFHGINQKNTNFMDGASMVNSCPVVPGSSMTYSFLADAPGTYWYHSHNMAQYPDGLRGPLIIHDHQGPYNGDYDDEVVLTVSDWYHSQTTTLVQAMLTPNNTQWRPPIPDGMITNEGGDRDIQFDIGKTTRVRIISFAALTGFMLHFDSRQMEVIMIDGSYVQKQVVDQLRIAPAQRYDILISGVNSDKGANIPYLVSMDLNRDYTTTATWGFNQTGYLVTDSSLPCDAVDVVDDWKPFDEGDFAPLDDQPAYGPVTKTWMLDFTLCKDANDIPRLVLPRHNLVGVINANEYCAVSASIIRHT
jgi:iron transport multicopper oxidase